MRCWKDSPKEPEDLYRYKAILTVFSRSVNEFMKDSKTDLKNMALEPDKNFRTGAIKAPGETFIKVTGGRSMSLTGAEGQIVLEEALVQASAGTQEALAALYAGTRTAVYGLALSIVKNRQDAEDVMQEVYVRLWQGAYRPEGKPMAWLLTVTRNLALDCLRRHHENALPPGMLDNRPGAAVCGALEPGWGSAVTVEDRLLLETLLDSLSEEERQIVVLHALWGLKHRETAAQLGLPLGTVLAKYNRALKKLREKGVE